MVVQTELSEEDVCVAIRNCPSFCEPGSDALRRYHCKDLLD